MERARRAGSPAVRAGGGGMEDMLNRYRLGALNFFFYILMSLNSRVQGLARQVGANAEAPRNGLGGERWSALPARSCGSWRGRLNRETEAPRRG